MDTIKDLTEQKLRAIIAEEVQVALSKILSRFMETADRIETHLKNDGDFRTYQLEKDRNAYELQMRHMITEQIQLQYEDVFEKLNRPKIEKDLDRSMEEWIAIMNDFGKDGNRKRIMTQYNLKRNTFYARLSWFWCRNHGFELIPPNHPADRFKGPILNKTAHRGRQRSTPNPVGSI
jgi:hypothetical protein